MNNRLGYSDARQQYEVVDVETGDVVAAYTMARVEELGPAEFARWVIGAVSPAQLAARIVGEEEAA